SQGNFTTTTAPDGTWALSSLAVGAEATLTVVLTVGSSTAAGTDVISDTAAVTDSTQNRVNTADDSASESTSVDRKINLVIEKSDGGVSSRRGQVVVYTLSYRNLGPSDATGVTLSETVPANTTFSAASSTAGWTTLDGAAAGTPGTFTIGPLAAGTVGSVKYAVKVNSTLPVGTKQISNTASIDDDHTAVELMVGDNSS